MKTSFLSSTESDALKVLQPMTAFVLLLALTGFLYYPHLFKINGLKLLIPLNSLFAAMGCYVITRRWISSFDASLLAAVVYGFGPFGLSFAAYHPFAGVCFAAVPWLLCPAVFYHAENRHGAAKACITSLLTLLPFVAIVGVFWSASHFGPLFLMPKHRMFELHDLMGFITPLLFLTEKFTLGFYHISAAMIVMGIFVFAVSGKETLLLPVAASIVMSLLHPIFDVTPIVWLCFPALFLSVLSGLGLQALAWAGKGDRKWILCCVIAALLLAATNYLLGQNSSGRLPYDFALYQYLAAAAGIGVILLMATLNLRWTFLRWLILFGLCIYDILMSSYRMVDSVF